MSFAAASDCRTIAIHPDRCRKNRVNDPLGEVSFCRPDVDLSHADLHVSNFAILDHRSSACAGSL
jgi:hypothetical protein